MMYPDVPWNSPDLNVDGGHISFPDDTGLGKDVFGLFPVVTRAEVPFASVPFNPLSIADRNGMSFFLFWILYSTQGRRLCRINKAGREGLARGIDADKFGPNNEVVLDAYYSDTDIRGNLRPAFKKLINPDNNPQREPVVEAALECHILAGHITYWREQLENVQSGKAVLMRTGLAIPPAADQIKLNIQKCSRDYQGALFLISEMVWDDFIHRDFDLTW